MSSAIALSIADLFVTISARVFSCRGMLWHPAFEFYQQSEKGGVSGGAVGEEVVFK